MQLGFNKNKIKKPVYKPQIEFLIFARWKLLCRLQDRRLRAARLLNLSIQPRSKEYFEELNMQLYH